MTGWYVLWTLLIALAALAYERRPAARATAPRRERELVG